MPQKTAHTVSAADLLVHGTYALRRALDRSTHPRPDPDEPTDQAMRPRRVVAGRLPGRGPHPEHVGRRDHRDTAASLSIGQPCSSKSAGTWSLTGVDVSSTGSSSGRR